MIFLIAGGTHTGKTLLAQRLLERYSYPTLSIDHLKMGLIRSGNTALTPESDSGSLTAYLWPIVAEMIRTCVENCQNLVVEGCYIPFSYRDSFTWEELTHIRYRCLIFSAWYIAERYEDILRHESAIEKRMAGWVSREELLRENRENLAGCRRHGCAYHLMEDTYRVPLELFETDEQTAAHRIVASTPDDEQCGNPGCAAIPEDGPVGSGFGM